MASLNTQPKEANAYLRTRVMSASPEELRLMLLDGAIKFAMQGRDALARKNFEGVFTGLSQCRDIVIELMTTIRDDLNAELAKNARAVYAFIYKQLVEGGHEKDDAKLANAIELLQYERETWVMLMQRLAEERRAGREAVAPEARTSISVQG